MDNDNFQKWKDMLDGYTYPQIERNKKPKLIELLYSMFDDWKEEHRGYILYKTFTEAVEESRKNGNR